MPLSGLLYRFDVTDDIGNANLVHGIARVQATKDWSPDRHLRRAVRGDAALAGHERFDARFRKRAATSLCDGSQIGRWHLQRRRHWAIAFGIAAVATGAIELEQIAPGR